MPAGSHRPGFASSLSRSIMLAAPSTRARGSWRRGSGSARHRSPSPTWNTAGTLDRLRCPRSHRLHPLRHLHGASTTAAAPASLGHVRQPGHRHHDTAPWLALPDHHVGSTRRHHIGGHGAVGASHFVDYEAGPEEIAEVTWPRGAHMSHYGKVERHHGARRLEEHGADRSTAGRIFRDAHVVLTRGHLFHDVGAEQGVGGAAGGHDKAASKCRSLDDRGEGHGSWHLLRSKNLVTRVVVPRTPDDSGMRSIL